MRAKVLLYRLDGGSEKGERLLGILAGQKILTLCVGEELLGQRVGRIVSTNAAAEGIPAPGDVPQTEFMLLCGLGERQLDRLLAAMRREGVSVTCKAVLTDTNRDWTLCKLIDEVAKEHESIKKLSP